MELSKNNDQQSIMIIGLGEDQSIYFESQLSNILITSIDEHLDKHSAYLDVLPISPNE